MTSSLEDVAERIAGVDALDRPATMLAEFSARQRGPVADLARGQPLGHRLHPLLTDLPIGFWTSALVLDIAGGRRSAGVSQALVGLGVVTAVPTAVAGVADVPLLGHHKRRVAVVHAASNAAATLLYARSWLARRRGHRVGGIVVSLVAVAVATVGGYLGGWLAFGREPSEQPAHARSAGFGETAAS